MSRRAMMMAAVLLALLAAAPGGATESAGRKEKYGKWITLFDGKDLKGWRHAGPGNFTVEEGALATHGGMGMLWFEGRKFRDFELEIEWKVSNKCNNSGVFVRFPDKSDDPMYAVNHGYEIQIDDCDKKGLKYQTGAIYDHGAATRLATKPAGEWNLYQIKVVGQHYTITLNGEKVNEFDGERGRDGYIGLQNHDITSRVSFRRVRVREIKGID